MSTEKIDKPGHSTPPLAVSPPVVADLPLRAGRARSRGAVWPMDTGASDDTFATPSEAAAGGIDPDSFASPEPAVFGGINPASSAEPVPAHAEAAPAAEPLGNSLDESVNSRDLLASAPRINFARLLRSTYFLFGGLIACLIGSTLLIRMVVPTETYVQTSVKFKNYDRLNEVEIQYLQTEMNNVLRTYPLRQQAWDMLQKKSPGVLPGFLASGLTFHRLDAIAWDPLGIIFLRIESDDPASDITRLSAITDAFYNHLYERLAKLDEFKAALAAQTTLHDQQSDRDTQLRLKIDELLPHAQRYLELKQAMQGIERYLELSDESNPLRFVAKENLIRLSGQVSAARLLSVQRDDLITERISLQKTSETVTEESSRLNRAIEVFAYPEAPKPASLLIHDTRDHQSFILRSVWFSLIALFAGIMAFFHITDHLAKERHRRDRRDLLQRRTSAPVQP